jgi:hypothetical protein
MGKAQHTKNLRAGINPFQPIEQSLVGLPVGGITALRRPAS